MKFLFVLILLAVTACKISAFNIQKDKETLIKDDWDSKHLKNQHDASKKFNRDQHSELNLGKLKKMDKVEKLDADLKQMGNTKLDTSRPARTYKRDKVYAQSTKLRFNDPKKHLAKDEGFKREIKKNAFKFNKKDKVSVVDKYRSEKPMKKATYNIQPASMQYKSISFKPNKIEDGLGSLNKTKSKLNTIDIKSNGNKFDSKTSYLKSGKKLMKSDSSLIKNRHMDKPFFGVYGEYDEIEPNFDHLKRKEHGFFDKQYFPSNEAIETQADKMTRGNQVLNHRLQHMDAMKMSPRFGDYKGESSRFAESGHKLDGSNSLKKGTRFDKGFKNLEDEGNGIFFRKGLMTNKLGARKDHKLEDNYDQFDSKLGMLSRSNSVYNNELMTGDDFQKGFGYMKKHAGKFSRNNMFGPGSMPGFSSIRK